MAKRECRNCAHWKQYGHDKYGYCDAKEKMVRDCNHCARWDFTLEWSVS